MGNFEGRQQAQPKIYSIMRLSSTRKPLIAALAFFVVLSAWSVSSPLGSAGDGDQHISSIWCAWGEKLGICEELDRTAIMPTARVPFMFYMDNGRPSEYLEIDYEVAHEKMRILRTANNDQMNLYYRIMRAFVVSSPTLSIVMMRLFSSLVATTMLLLLLIQTRGKIRHGVLAAWTFVLIPVTINYFTAINPRGWAILGVMSGWAFLQSFIETPNTKVKRRIGLSASYFTSFLLVATCRWDATIYFMVVTLLLLAGDWILKERITAKTAAMYGLGAVLFLMLLRSIPRISNHRISNYLELGHAASFPARQFIVFQIVHIPESIGDVWGYTVGQQGNGPGIIGMIGLSLFVLAIGFSLQKSSRIQQILVSSAALFTCLTVYRGSTLFSSLVPAPGTYVIGLVSFVIGIAIAFSPHDSQFMSNQRNRIAAIALLSFTHLLAFFARMEFYTRRGENIGLFVKLSLRDAWWWGPETNPNIVFIVGATFFPIFLIFAWKATDETTPTELLAP